MNYTYWFFLELFDCYCSIPVLASIPDTIRIVALQYLLISSLLMNNLFPFVFTYLHVNISWSFHISLGKSYIIYFIAGYLLHKKHLTDIEKWVLYGSGLLGFLTHLFGTYLLSMKSGKIIMTYKGYTNLPCFAHSSAIYYFFKEHLDSMLSRTILILVNFLDKYSFGIYYSLLYHAHFWEYFDWHSSYSFNIFMVQTWSSSVNNLGYDSYPYIVKRNTLPTGFCTIIWDSKCMRTLYSHLQTAPVVDRISDFQIQSSGIVAY